MCVFFFYIFSFGNILRLEFKLSFDFIGFSNILIFVQHFIISIPKILSISNWSGQLTKEFLSILRCLLHQNDLGNKLGPKIDRIAFHWNGGAEGAGG